MPLFPLDSLNKYGNIMHDLCPCMNRYFCTSKQKFHTVIGANRYVHNLSTSMHEQNQMFKHSSLYAMSLLLNIRAQ